MSGVPTKKMGGDYATQLTFPAVFEEQAKRNGLTYGFYPEQQHNAVFVRGSGIQEDYHEQKRLDANRRALNGVKDTAASIARFLSSHANYNIPKPVLGQRIFANPSNGNQADIYSNRPVFLSGGVLRTKEGQEYGLRKLKERIPQLDAIKAAKEAFLMGIPATPLLGEIGVADITTKVELYGLLTLVESDVEQSSVDVETVNRSRSALKLMFSFIPVAEVSEVEETMAKVEMIQQKIGGIEENYADGQGTDKEGQIMKRKVDFLKILYDRMREYLVRMNGVAGRPRKEREKISAVFVKSLGFAELEKQLPKETAAEKRAYEEAEARNPNAESASSSSSSSSFLPVYERSDSVSSFPAFERSDSGSFLSPSLYAPIEEDDEPRLDIDQREVFAAESGSNDPRSNMASAQMSEEVVPQAMPEFDDVKEEVLDLTVPASRGPLRIAMSAAETDEVERLRSSAQEDDEALERQRGVQREFDERIRFLNARSLDDENIAATKAQLQANGLYRFSKATGADFRKYLKRNDILGRKFAVLVDIDRLEKKILRRELLERKARAQAIRRPVIGDVGLPPPPRSPRGSGKKGKGKVKRDENFFMNLLKGMRMNSVEH